MTDLKCIKKWPVGVALFVVISLALVSCSAVVTPISSPPVAKTSTPASTATPSSSIALSPEDAALKKLVEAAQKERSVTLYSFNFVGDAGLAIQKALRERYGINVDIITGRGAELTERLKTEARMGNRTGDYVEGSQVYLISTKAAGLTVSLKDLPVLMEKDVWKVDPAFLDPEAHILAEYPTFAQSFINTRLVKPDDEPKSWFDLLQPKWKGQILFSDPVVSSTAYIFFQPLVKRGILTEDYLVKLGAQDLIFVTGPAEAMERLARGNAPIFVGSQAIDASNAVREGAPIKVIDFKEGVAGQGIIQAVVKDAPHINAAKLFVNWFLSKEGQSVYTKAKGSPTIRKDVHSGLPAPLDMDPTKPVMPTSDDVIAQGKMFSDKVWVPLLKKGK